MGGGGGGGGGKYVNKQVLRGLGLSVCRMHTAKEDGSRLFAHNFGNTIIRSSHSTGHGSAQA